VEAFAEYVTRAYHGATGIEPSIFGVEASPGACELTAGQGRQRCATSPIASS